MVTFFAKEQDWERKSYTGILKHIVLCDSMIQAASYWSSVPNQPNLFPEWGDGPCGYPTALHPAQYLKLKK